MKSFIFNVKNHCAALGPFLSNLVQKHTKFDLIFFYKAHRNLSICGPIFKWLQDKSQENQTKPVDDHQNDDFDDEKEDDDFHDFFRDRSHHLPHHHSDDFLQNLSSFLEICFATMLTICSTKKLLK